jgi:hypothetical protein
MHQFSKQNDITKIEKAENVTVQVLHHGSYDVRIKWSQIVTLGT